MIFKFSADDLIMYNDIGRQILHRYFNMIFFQFGGDLHRKFLLKMAIKSITFTHIWKLKNLQVKL